MIRQDHHDHAACYIYVLLTHTGTVFTTLVKQFTSAPYNHASLALDAALDEVFSFGRKHPANPLSAGFVKEDLYEGVFSHFPQTRCVLLRLQVSSRQRNEIIRIIQSFVKDQHAYRYNLIGLFGVLLNRHIETKKSYFCSQFVAHTLSRGGVCLWDRPSSLVTPDDFLQHPAFEKVYEGRLYDYPLLKRDRLQLRPQSILSSLRASCSAIRLWNKTGIHHTEI